MSSAPAIVTEHLGRSFGDFKAVDDVTFSVERGEVFGYLGANGAGKSTTIRMLCGLLAPTSGDASVAGHSVRADPGGVKSSIGYMSQKFSLYLDLPIRHNLEFFGGAYGLGRRELARRIDAVLTLTDMHEHAGAVTRTLPAGIRQRAALACALLHEPEIVFLDEPTAGVDPLSRRRFWRLIRDLSSHGTTIFVTTHYMDEAEYCHRVGLMVSGRLVALDTPLGLKRTYVPGQTFAVYGDLSRVVDRLRARDGIVAVQTFGTGLHVRAQAQAYDVSAMRTSIEELGGRVESIEEVEPSLEDVFLEVVAPRRTEAA